DLFDLWLNNYDDYEITNRVYKELDYNKAPYLKDIASYIPKRSVWTIGGDGWAYDIGFGGIDQVLSSNDNVNILVLDTQVYSNTGGQSSKASERGSIAKFNSSGKKTAKKDLAKIALAYPNVYIASIAMGANMNQTIKALTEAEAHDGPSLIIAYSPCISHGIKKGSSYTMKEEELAVKSGYVSIFRYQPQDNKFILDYKEPDFNLLDSFFEGEKRFSMLKAVNPLKGQELLEQLKVDAKNRFKYYQKLSQ
ncbi:MAG: thiamine pyrophosphate-dependent enzyme, partial [Bacilli bacterium]